MKSQNIGTNFAQAGNVYNKKSGSGKKQFASLPSDSFAKSESIPQGIDFSKAASILAKSKAIAGKELWKNETDLRFTTYPVQGKNNSVYIASINSSGHESRDRLLSIDADTGKTNWEFKTGGGCRSAVTVGPNETVYACCYKTGIFAVDGYSGTEVWNFKEEPRGFGMVPTLGNDGTLYAGSPSGKVYAIDSRTGKKIWDFKTDNEVYSTPVLGKDNTVFVGSYDHKFYALDTKTGKEKWSVDMGSNIFADPVYGQDDTVYIGTGNHIHALNGKDGKEKWSFETDSDAGSPILAKDGTMYVGDWDGNVYAIDTKNQKQLWKKKFNGMTKEKPTLTPDGKLFITAGGKLQVLDAKTGRKSWEFDTKEKTSFGGVSLSPDGKAYLATEEKSVYAVVYDKDLLIYGSKQEETSENGAGNKSEQSKESKPMEIKMGKGFVDIGGVKLNVNK